MEDTQIVALFLARDENAITQVTQKYGGRLRALAFGILADRQAAEECESDTYLQAWHSIPPHEPCDYLYAFLARITRHTALNRCRERGSRKRRAQLCRLTDEMAQCLPAPDDAARHMDTLAFGDLLNDFLRSLNDTARVIFLRRYWYCDTIADIARRYSLSQSNVKTSLSRSRARLRERLEKEGYTV